MTATNLSAAAQQLLRAAGQLAPLLRERGAAAERARRIQDATIDDAREAGLLRLMVPERLGGWGLGVTELCEVCRTLAQGDASAAWVIGFLIEHNWLACRLPLSAQERLYQGADHVKTASTLQPNGKATRVEGGYRVSGRWSYASGLHHAQWTFVNAALSDGSDQGRWALLLPAEALSVTDDWHMAGMAATGSVSFAAEDVFVPGDMALPLDELHSATDHHGRHHPGKAYRQPVLPAAAAMLASFPLGAAQGMLALALERLSVPNAAGQRSVDRAEVQLRWARAHQLIRTAELLWRDVLARIDALVDRPWSSWALSQLELDRVSIVHGSKEASRLLLDGLGASALRLDDPLQRYARDIQTMANHIAHAEDAVLLKGIQSRLTTPHDTEKD